MDSARLVFQFTAQLFQFCFDGGRAGGGLKFRKEQCSGIWCEAFGFALGLSESGIESATDALHVIPVTGSCFQFRTESGHQVFQLPVALQRLFHYGTSFFVHLILVLHCLPLFEAAVALRNQLQPFIPFLGLRQYQLLAHGQPICAAMMTSVGQLMMRMRQRLE